MSNSHTPQTTDEQYQSNYTPREKLLHKLTGAAYQATFDGDYELVVDICEMILEYETGSVVPRPADSETLSDGADIVDADAIEVTTRTWRAKDLGNPMSYDRVEDAVMESVLADGEEDTDIEDDTQGVDTEETASSTTEDDEIDADDVSLPGVDTKAADILRALYRCHTAGEIEWATTAQASDKATVDIDSRHFSAYADEYDCIRTRNVEGQYANEYRIPSALHYEVGQTMFGGES